MCFNGYMKKSYAIYLIAEGHQSNAAKELGITRQTLAGWPDILDQQKIDLVNGVLLRLEKQKLPNESSP